MKINVFVLLTITLYGGGLSFVMWNLHTQSVSLKTDDLMTEFQSLKIENQNQNTELRSLKSENANLHNQITKLQDIVATNPNPYHSSDEATVMDPLKRLTRKSRSSQNAHTDLLADDLTKKKLYTIMECARNDDNLTDCSLKPGPKGDKGCLGDQGKEGPQGIHGEPGVKGHIGYPGYNYMTLRTPLKLGLRQSLVK